jgi:hypothetical protein
LIYPLQPSCLSTSLRLHSSNTRSPFIHALSVLARTIILDWLELNSTGGKRISFLFCLCGWMLKAIVFVCDVDLHLLISSSRRNTWDLLKVTLIPTFRESSQLKTSKLCPTFCLTPLIQLIGHSARRKSWLILAYSLPKPLVHHSIFQWSSQSYTSSKWLKLPTYCACQAVLTGCAESSSHSNGFLQNSRLSWKSSS